MEVHEEQVTFVQSKVCYENSRYMYRGMKRIFDIVFSLLGLIALLPVFLVVASAIKLESKGGTYLLFSN